MARKRRPNKQQFKKIAKVRINRLFSLAEQAALAGELKRADRYVQLARKISMRYLVPMPRDYKRRFCKYCYAYLIPGKTARIRIHRGKIILFCFRCQHFTRMPIGLREH